MAAEADESAFLNYPLSFINSYHLANEIASRAVLRVFVILAYNPTAKSNDKIQSSLEPPLNGGLIVESAQWQNQTTR